MEKFITIEEAAVAFGVSAATMRRIVKRESIPSYKVGRRVVFDPAEIKSRCMKKVVDNG